MSGSSIGGIAGGLIGFAIGGPAGAQWGWMIGSVIGGIVDPQTIQGAQWQNQQLQGSADGLGRAVIFGTATVTGNLLDAEPDGPRIGKKTEGGKGGPEVERDTAILTYAIEICDSSELRGTKVNGVIAVWEDEKLVYDLRPGSQLGMADSAKWAENKKFYYGSESQTAAPELEAIHGSGNVPAYRGSCIMVVHDEDLMVDVDDKPRGRIPTYRFLVSQCSIVPVVQVMPTAIVYGSANSTRVISSDGVAIGTSNANVTLSSDQPVSGSGRFLGGVAVILSDCKAFLTLDNMVWASLPALPYPSGYATGNLLVEYKGDLYAPGAGVTYTYFRYSGSSWSYGAGPSTGYCRIVSFAVSNDTLYGIANSAYDGIFATNDGITFAAKTAAPLSGLSITSKGSRLIAAGSSSGTGKIAYSDDGATTWTASTISGPSTTAINAVQGISGNLVIAVSDLGFHVSTDNGVSFHPTLAGKSPSTNDINCISYDPGSTVTTITTSSGAVQTIDGVAYWPVTFSGDVPPSASVSVAALLTGTPIPDAPGYYVAPDGSIIGPSLGEGTECGAPLDQVVRKLHKLGAPQLSDAEFALEPLEGDTVRGYAIQDAAVTVAEACEPLRKVWTFDLPSYDGQIHAIKRGRDVDWTLPEDDLIAMDSDYEQSMQDDTVSLPRKLHLTYNDPSLDYKETTQISERYSADVRVVGEEKISMGQLVMSATEAKQAVVKQHKLAWLNAEDTRTLSAPLEYIGAVNSDIVQFRGRRYRIDQMRVEGLKVTFESAAYDRASSYQSTAVGTEGVPPPPMGSSLRGPTVSVFMNLPVLRDADDKAGIYWAASGLLEGWRGASLQIARDGVTFTDTGVSVAAPATMGTLIEAVGSASRYGMDEVNQIMVKLNPLSPGLDSTDMDGLLREANGAALVYPDGTAEVIQFLTATETAPREYTLSGLLRGRLDTTPGAHSAGAWFVLLNDAIRFVPLRNDDSGTSPTFRAVSAGTVAENNDSVALTLGSFKSLTEWEPAMVRATTGTNEVSVTWAGRGRLGSSRMPVHSLNFDKYRVRVTKSGTTATVEIGDQYATVTYTGITEPYTTGVTALSRIDPQFNSPEGTA